MLFLSFIFISSFPTIVPPDAGAHPVFAVNRKPFVPQHIHGIGKFKLQQHLVYRFTARKLHRLECLVIKQKFFARPRLLQLLINLELRLNRVKKLVLAFPGINQRLADRLHAQLACHTLSKWDKPCSIARIVEMHPALVLS